MLESRRQFAKPPLQSDAPDAPTGLTATPRKDRIDFTWTLSEFWAANGISELWEYTAKTPFASATKIWEGNSNQVTIEKTDAITRYYWVRIRTINAQFSATEPSGNGLPAWALSNDVPSLTKNSNSRPIKPIGIGAPTPA